MKRIYKSVLWAASIGFAAALAGASETEHCRLDTLQGTMVYASTAKNAQSGVEWSLSGQETYDGKGHMKYHEFLSYGLTSSVYDGTGTYTVSSNCIATVTYIDPTGESPPDVWLFFLSVDGEHYYWNNNQNNGVLSAGRADQVSRALLIP